MAPPLGKQYRYAKMGMDLFGFLLEAALCDWKMIIIAYITFHLKYRM